MTRTPLLIETEPLFALAKTCVTLVTVAAARVSESLIPLPPW